MMEMVVVGMMKMRELLYVDERWKWQRQLVVLLFRNEKFY